MATSTTKSSRLVTREDIYNNPNFPSRGISVNQNHVFLDSEEPAAFAKNKRSVASPKKAAPKKVAPKKAAPKKVAAKKAAPKKVAAPKKAAAKKSAPKKAAPKKAAAKKR